MTVMPESLPSETESATWFDTLSNWGRWGPDDQLGTLNLITEQHRVAAAKLVRIGRTISCARPLQTTFGDPTSAAQMYWVCTGESACAPDGSALQSKFGTGRVQAALEYVGMVFHGANCTHVDTPAHLFWENRAYNDRPAGTVSAEFGAVWCDVMNMSDGVMGRGVLLDIPRLLGSNTLEPGTAVTPQQLIAAAQLEGVTIGEGDVVLLRSGRWHPDGSDRTVDDPTQWHKMSGWHPACMPWLYEHGVAMIGCDYPQEAWPSVYPESGAGVHSLGLVKMGLPMIDNCDLERLAIACAELGRWEFQFVMSPLPLVGGSGSPVNPLAIF